ncbi:hypothetical protein NM04_14920 [Massilia aurea]|uniref:Uncharacterized protein n=1 Tax=Massilia aurea TaxID=373040 RepID=A0A422QJG1_9BURK|nr:hypothetical protein [Massilia aurea]RNF30031.1 hypothetical protein NM04_14920 [Massilia aurea]
MKESNAPQVAGQLIYFEAAERAAPAAQRTMAKVALSVAGEGTEAPATMDEVLALRWDDYQAVLMLLALAPNFRIRWAARHLNLLRLWSGSADAAQPDEPLP